MRVCLTSWIESVDPLAASAIDSTEEGARIFHICRVLNFSQWQGFLLLRDTIVRDVEHNLGIWFKIYSLFVMINLDISLKDEDLSWAHWTNVRQLQVDIYVVQHDHMPLATLWKLELFDRSYWRTAPATQLARKHVEAFTKTTTSVIVPFLTHGYENWPVFDVYVVAPDLVTSLNTGLRKTASHEQLLLVVMCKA